jgi:hypothetical protein
MPKFLRPLSTLIALLPLLTACGLGGGAPVIPTPVPGPTAEPTATRQPPTATPEPTVITPEAIEGDLQAVVTTERRAVENSSPELFMSVIDKGDRDWYKFQEDEFVNDSDLTGRLDCISNIRIGEKGDTAEADVAIDSCPGRYHVGMFFRLVDGQWLHSQPGLDEQGLRATKKFGPFSITYHQMEEPYLPALERFASGVYERVSGVMSTRTLDVDVDLLSRPTDMPKGAFTTIALYNPLTRRMSMLSPRFWPNGDGTEVALDDQIRTTLTHEFTHHAVRTLAQFQVPHWLNEGMAVYVSGENTTRFIRDNQQLALANRLLPPEALDQALDSGDTAEFGYAEGYGFVQYLTSQEGDTILPQLLKSLSETGSLDQSLRQVTGKGLTVWWKAWIASLKE